MALFLSDNTEQFIHPSLKHFFQTDKFKKQYKAFKKAYRPSILSSSQTDIMAFKNDYLYKECLLEGDEINVSLNITDYLKNKNSASLFNASGKSKIKKDDFLWAFQSEIWQYLNFDERFTMLHWLQQSCGAKGELPKIDFISSVFLMDSSLVGAYDSLTNKLLINPSSMGHGLGVAGYIVHEMEHFKQCNNQANTSSGIQVAKKHGIELKHFGDYNLKEKRALINMDFKDLSQKEQLEVLRFKYLVCAPGVSNLEIEDVESFETFSEYMKNEYYLQSPPEKEAHIKQAKGLQSIIGSFLYKPNQEDKQEVFRAKYVSSAINSQKLTPVLRMLLEDEKLDLQNTSVQDTFYYRHICDEKIAQHYKEQHDNKLEELYQYAKDSEGGLSKV